MKRLGVSILTLAVASAAWGEGKGAAWREDAPCGERLPAPVETVREGCVSSWCVPADGARICSCLAATDVDALELVREKDGAAALRWKVELHSIPDASAFRVDRMDLGAPPAPALLVAVRAGVGNGMGVEDWSLRAIRGDELSEPGPADDYGILAFATRAPRERECRVLATRWLWSTDPARGDGLYLYGRWLHLHDGALTPDPTRPLIARRYLFRFESQRAAARNAERPDPIPWFRAATAKPPPCDDAFCR